MRTTPYPNPSNTWDGGIVFPGWHCRADDCGVFNGEEKEKRAECRSCGRPRGWIDCPEPGDPGEVGCRTLHEGTLVAPAEHGSHQWVKGSARCQRCGAHAIRGHFGEELRQKKLAKRGAS